MQVANLHYGLEPVFRANGIEWHPLPVSKKEVLHWVLRAIIVVMLLYYSLSLFSSIWISF
jgi:hypothetical protein